MTVPETFISQSVSNISQIAIETLNEGEGKFLGIFDKSLNKKNEQAIATASAIYAQQYLQRYGRANLFGMGLSVPLDSIYIEVPLWLSPEPELLESLQNYSNKISLLNQQAGNVKELSIGNKMGNQMTHRTALGVDAVNENRYLVVLGATGAGKSTFLRKIGLDILQGKKLGKFLPRTYIPMLLECKTLSNPAVSLEQSLVNLFRASDFPLAEKLTKKALDRGRFLILLDGVDELDSEHRQKTIAQIEAFIEQYPKNHFIVSDRIASTNPWQKLMPIALANFNSEQIAQGIEGWFAVSGQDSTAAQSFLHALQQPEHQAVKMLARLPWWLNLLCCVYHHHGIIPRNGILLYQQAIDILLAQIAPKLNQAAIESWLSEIAYQSLVTEKLYFSQSDLIDQMPAEMISSANGATAKEILGAIATDRGILSPIASDRLAFSHPNGQNFFAAKYILEHRLMAIAVKESLTVWRWQEVFLFVAGLRTPNADKLLWLIEAEAQEYIERDDGNKHGNKLRSLLDWSDRVTADTNADTNTGAIVPAAKRTAALFTVFALQQTFNDQNPLINELDLSLENNPLLTNSLQLSQSLGLNLTFAIENTRSLTNDFRQNLTFALSQPLDIDKLSRNLTRNLARKLAQDRARYLSLSFDRIFSDRPEMSLDRARDLAFVSILTNQLQTMPVFTDISSLIADLESLQANIPSNNDSAQVHSKFRQQLWETCLNSLQLDTKLLQLTPGEKKSLSDYFSACSLLVRCRETAVDVTPETWQTISGRMVKLRG